MVKEEIKWKNTQKEPPRFSKVKYGHHYLLAVKTNFIRKLQIERIWTRYLYLLSRILTRDSNVVDLECSYLVDFEEHIQHGRIQNLLDKFEEHKNGNNSVAVFAHLEDEELYINTQRSIKMVEFVMELQKATGLGESDEEISYDYNALYNTEIPKEINDLINNKPMDGKSLLRLKKMIKKLLEIGPDEKFIKYPEIIENKELISLIQVIANNRKKKTVNNWNQNNSVQSNPEQSSSKSESSSDLVNDPNVTEETPLLPGGSSQSHYGSQAQNTISNNIESIPFVDSADDISQTDETGNKSPTTENIFNFPCQQSELNTSDETNNHQSENEIHIIRKNSVGDISSNSSLSPPPYSPPSPPEPSAEENRPEREKPMHSEPSITNDPSNISSSESQNTTVLINHNNVINEYELKDITPHKVKTDFNIQYGILELASDEITSKEESDNQFEPPLVPGTYTLIVQKNTMIRINYKDLEKEFDVNDVSPSKIKLAFEIKSGEIDLSSEEMTCKEKNENEFEPSLLSGAYRLTVRDPKEFTVIFLGESGVGKSTLISGLGNYLNWPTFEEAKKNQMQICIPVEFKVQRKLEEGGFDETTVRAGTVEDNENFNDVGQSVTQKPKVHEFTFQNNTVKVIDTPGLSDTRGAEQDKKNLDLIREFIHDQKEIHAICIVLKSNDARLRPEFELALRDLLSLFPKPALKNVFFFFTYASGTFFGIGDSTGPVKEMQKKIQDSHEATYSFEGENTCAVDSESFKFLLCEERGVKYSNRPEEDFDFCWNESAAQVKDFLTFIKTVKPIEKKITLAVHHLVTTALRLEKFIRTSDQLTLEQKDSLVKESKIIMSTARKYSMVIEYHRLITDVTDCRIEEFCESCDQCEKIVKTVDRRLSEDISEHVKETGYLLQSHNEAEKFNHEDKHGISQPKIEEVVNNSKQPPIANTDQQNQEGDISSFEIIDNDEDKTVPIETRSTENDTIGQISKENGISPPSLPITTKSPLVEKPEMSPPPAEVTPEWDKIITVYQEHETISLPKKFTIIFLGESGVGKSTLISGLGNYLNWPTFEEAKKNQMQVCIPLQFKVQRRGADKKIIETIVRAGDPEDNENFNDIGQSVTQQPKVHQFTFQENIVKFIDTPGLSDSRGAEQDKKNLELIRECIHNQKEIHAICIVLKSNDARLRPEFELALRDLLSLFPKPALKNVFFFFTYASGTFFGIGDSTGPVKEMQKKIQDSHEATYSFEGENTCAVDSESFKFLLCKERGVKYSNRPEEDFDFCWNESAAQVKDFLTFIKTVKPIEKKITLAVHHLVSTALSLEEFIRTTDQLTQRKRDHLVNESKIILNVARKWSMVTEYHRLKTDLEHWSVDEFKESCRKCEKFLKNVNTNFTKETFKRLKKENNLLMVKNATQITTLPNLVVVSPSVSSAPSLPKSKPFTIIFLGESGVGKSTLISGLGNYLNWPTFEEAKKNQMQICIPVEFKVQRKLEEGGFDETTVRAGDFEDNENFNSIGQSVTQKPKVHEFTFQNNTVKVIDTPGLSDTRGAEQDKKNLELIRECIHDQKEIHAICIVLKSNESKLGNQFELAIRDLLSLFPKSALKNVFFFFTYARGTYFGIGDILNPLKELQQKFKDSHGVSFEFEGRNMCPVDSESFRYLLCKEQGIKYSSSAEERFEYCWNETAKQVLDFLGFLKSVDPVDVEKIKAAHEIAKTTLGLEEFLRTDKALKKGLSDGARELLKKRADPLFCIARSLTMVPEYYRLKTEKVELDSTSVAKSMYELLPVVKNSNVLHDGLSKFAENVSLLKGNNS